MARYVALIVAFALLVGVFFVGLQKDPSQLPSTFIGKPAPEFELPSLTDPAVRVSHRNFGGKPALLNVWATWCVGCRQEHGFLMELAATNSIPIYGLNWRDDRAAALQWLAQYGDPYVITAFDADARVGIDWGVYAAPETFLINPDGMVVHKHLGPLDPAIWERDFAPLIAGMAAAQ